MEADCFSDLEREVMRMLLAGDHPVLVTLREQFALARPGKREMTGVGFFTDFIMPTEAPRVSSANVVIGDVEADIEGLPHGASFLLFIRDGLLSFLEGCCVDDKWPDGIKTFTLRYFNPRGRIPDQYGRGLPPLP